MIIDAPPAIVFKAVTDPIGLPNRSEDQAILEPNAGGRMKLSIYKDSKKGRTIREIDYFPEATIIEFIPSKNRRNQSNNRANNRTNNRRNHSHQRISYALGGRRIVSFPEQL